MADRYVRGVLQGFHAAPGTILGPNALGELMVVVEDRTEGVALGFATTFDIGVALEQPEPRSVTEVTLRRQQAARAARMRAVAEVDPVSAANRTPTDGRSRAGRTRRERRVWRPK